MGTVGFVGLGEMGSRMVRRLLDAGHTVVGYNRTRAKAQPLIDRGMRYADSPRAAAESSEAVLTMVTDTAALEAVAHGAQGIVEGLRPGAVWVEMSTVSPGAARALSPEVVRRKATIITAPVSGSPVTLDAGQLSFVVGGDRDALERVRPYLLAIGPTITHVGELEHAVSMKIAINLGLAVQMLAFSEAVLLAEKAGIARETAIDAIMRSVVASPMIKYRGPFVLGMKPFFSVPMIQKDLQLALDLARAQGVPMPTTSVTQEWMTAARGLGLGAYDFAVVFDVLARLSGLPPSAKLSPPPTG